MKHRRLINITILVALFFTITSCTSRYAKHINHIPTDDLVISNRKTNITLALQNNTDLPYLSYKKIDTYSPTTKHLTSPFILKLSVNPLMRDVTFIARTKSRTFAGKRASTDNHLTIIIPFIKSNETVVVETSYEWMDIKWLPPIKLDEQSIAINNSELTVSIPYGTNVNFKSALNLSPKKSQDKNPIWKSEVNEEGLGTIYHWSYTHKEKHSSSKLLPSQIYLSFEAPSHSETKEQFNNWSDVSSYIYKKFDRFDLPSSMINEWIQRETFMYVNNSDKVDSILNFLHNKIEIIHASKNIYEQTAHPASRTFSHKKGSPLDIVLLGKAMLKSIGIEANILAVTDKRYNQSFSNFFTPAIFNRAILEIKLNKDNIHYDPIAAHSHTGLLDYNLQGQTALIIKPSNGYIKQTPYSNAQRNTQAFSYQLWMLENGDIEGEYSVDINGFKTKDLAKMLNRPVNDLNLQDIEKALFNDAPAFNIESCDIEKTQPIEYGVVFYGTIKPFSLKKTNNNNFVFDIANIIKPVISKLHNALSPNYSSSVNINLSIKMPDNLLIEKLPSNINTQYQGLKNQIIFSNKKNQLELNINTTISLPQANNIDTAVIESELAKVKLLSEQPLLIFDGKKNDNTKQKDS